MHSPLRVPGNHSPRISPGQFSTVPAMDHHVSAKDHPEVPKNREPFQICQCLIGKLPDAAIPSTMTRNPLFSGLLFPAILLTVLTSSGWEFPVRDLGQSTRVQPETVRRLALTAKVWGFLKYYHPGAGTMNWDSVLVALLPRVRTSGSITQFEDILWRFFETAGDYTPIQNDIKTDSLKTSLDWDWLERIQSSELRGRIARLIETGNGGAANNFVTAITSKGERLSFARYSEKSYKEMPFPSEEFRLLGLFRFWNIVEFFYPYKDLMDQDWDDTLVRFIPSFLNASDTLQYHLTVKELVTYLNDGHGFAYSSVIGEHFGGYLLPFEINFIEGRYIVGNSRNDSLFVTSGLQKGDVIIKIHGDSLEKRIRYIKRYFGGSNQSAINGKDVPELLGQWTDTVSSITVRRGEKTLYTRLRFHTARDIFSGQGGQATNIWKFVEPGIGYVHMGLLRNPDTLAALFSDLEDTKGIILDFRHYPRFQIMYKFLTHVYDENTPFGLFTSPVLEMPGYFRSHHEGFLFEEPAATRYSGKLVLLVNERSGSLGEFFPMALQMLPQTTTIGSQTWGADGNQVGFAMPGGISVGFSGLGIFYPDGTVCQRKGLKIDIEVKPTLKGFIEGRDEVLERAIRYLE